jgi:hypothetical protein
MGLTTRCVIERNKNWSGSINSLESVSTSDAFKASSYKNSDESKQTCLYIRLPLTLVDRFKHGKNREPKKKKRAMALALQNVARTLGGRALQRTQAAELFPRLIPGGSPATVSSSRMFGSSSSSGVPNRYKHMDVRINPNLIS